MYSNEELQKLLDDGYEVGFTRHTSLPDEATAYNTAFDFGCMPGNVCVRHPKSPPMLAINVRPISYEAGDDDLAWANLMNLGGTSLTIRLSGSFLWRVFSLGSFERVNLGEIPVGKLSSATITDYWMLPGGKVVTDRLMTAEIVGGMDKVLPLPDDLKAELARYGRFEEAQW